MIVRKCANIDCQVQLKTAPEIKTGLCLDCQAMLDKKNTYAGLCWNCNSITLIGEIPKRLIGVLNEKYLFTRKCSNCIGTHKDNIEWLTFQKLEPFHRLAVNQEGKLCWEESKLSLDHQNQGSHGAERKNINNP